MEQGISISNILFQAYFDCCPWFFVPIPIHRNHSPDSIGWLLSFHLTVFATHQFGIRIEKLHLNVFLFFVLVCFFNFFSFFFLFSVIVYSSCTFSVFVFVKSSSIFISALCILSTKGNTSAVTSLRLRSCFWFNQSFYFFSRCICFFILRSIAKNTNVKIRNG